MGELYLYMVFMFCSEMVIKDKTTNPVFTGHLGMFIVVPRVQLLLGTSVHVVLD